jgi:copper chaperone
MEQLKFETNLKCSGCVASATPFLDKAAGHGNWSVNLTDTSKTLTVNGNKSVEHKIIEALGKAGYKGEAL